MAEDPDRIKLITTTRLEEEVKPAHVSLVTYYGALGFPNGYAFDGGFGGGRAVDPHWVFEVDFSFLAPGGHDAGIFFLETAAQRTNKGMTFARSSGATVQVGADSVATGLGNNTARIGVVTNNKGLVIEPVRINGVNSTGVSYARNILSGTFASPVIPRFFYPDLGHTAVDTAQSQPGVQTVDAGAGPDGVFLADQFVSISGPKYSGGGLHLGNAGVWSTAGIFNNVPLTFSVWAKSTSNCRLHWMTRYPWDQGPGVIDVVDELTWAGSGVWERKRLSRTLTGALGPTTRPIFVFNDGIDRTDEGGTAPVGTVTSLVDLIQLEVDNWVGEVILTSDGICQGDRLSYVHGNELSVGGRMRVYVSFFPKHNSTDQVSSTANIASNSGVTGFSLWSWDDSGTRIRCDIIQGGGDSYKFAFNAADHHALFHTTETIAWAADDFVEVFVEVGAGQPTQVRYRINSGSWVVMTPVGALNNVTPTGTVNFFWSGVDETCTPAWRVKEIRAYDSAGDPDDPLPIP